MNIFLTLWSLPYFRWHLLFVIIPSILLWSLYWRVLFSYKKTLILLAAACFVGGFFMDMTASVWLRIWHFNNIKSLGISFLGLPVGEYFFLLFVPQELIGIFLVMRHLLKYGKI